MRIDRGGGDIWMPMAIIGGARAFILSRAVSVSAMALGPLALGALAGCGKPAGQPASAAMPQRRDGLWEQTLAKDGKPGKLGVLKICVDPAVNARFGVFGRHFDKGACQHSISRDPGGAYRFGSTCNLDNGAVVVTRGVATGDFQAGYEVHSDISISGAPFAPMNGMHAIRLSGRYLGPCPANMHPGDINLGSGLRINLDQLPKIAAAVGGGGF